MTAGKWDAEAWHKHRTHALPQRDRKPIVYMVVAAFVLIAAGVSATQIPENQEMVGVCHHTGDGYVFLVVAKDGYEHGHHRHNPMNYFVSPTAGCGGDEPWIGPAEPVETEPIQSIDEPIDVDPEPVDNATDAPDGADNATVAPEEPENVTAEPVPDAAVRMAVEQESETAWVTIRVLSLGDGDVQDVALRTDLPDVGRAWSLTGADAADCVLGDVLDCWFGDLAPGASRDVVLVAHLDQMPCGDGVVMTSQIEALGDDEARNDASSAGIVPRHC